MAKLGYVLHDSNDSEMTWNGERCEVSKPIIIDTYKDHRMAMTFAPLSIKLGKLFINNARSSIKIVSTFLGRFTKGRFLNRRNRTRIEQNLYEYYTYRNIDYSRNGHYCWCLNSNWSAQQY